MQDCLSLIYNENGVKEIKELMDNTGICCFTKDLPSSEDRNHFPGRSKNNPICIKYNKDRIEKWLLDSKYAIANPFHDVVYSKQPLKIETDGGYHIAIQSDENGTLYESILSIAGDFHLLDKLVYRLLSSIDYRFSKQKEVRIIMGGRNLCYLKDGANGYEVEIPQDVIEQVFVYKNCPQDYVKRLCKIPSIANKIQKS